ncbi:MAG: SemiSWEET family transporter [Patescibacteria group bacterium]
MPAQSMGLHHFHKRKRVHENLEPYPHPDKIKRFMDKAIFVVGVVGPIMTLPQIFKIWVEKQASGISIVSFTAYLFVAAFWILYGLLHKEKPIVVTQSIWFIMHVFIVIGAIIYGT